MVNGLFRVAAALSLALALFGLPLSEAPAQHKPMADHGDAAGGKGIDAHQAEFDDPERWAKSFDDPARDAWQKPDQVIGALSLRPSDVVADIGAGTGYFSVRLARAVPQGRVLAVDVAPRMVAYLAQRARGLGLANLRAVQGGAASPNLPVPADVVLVVNTYHHIADRVAYFRALRAALKPGARLAVIDFRLDARQGAPRHFRLAPERIAAELADAGYRLSASHDLLPRQTFQIFTAAP